MNPETFCLLPLRTRCLGVFSFSLLLVAFAPTAHAQSGTGRSGGSDQQWEKIKNYEFPILKNDGTGNGGGAGGQTPAQFLQQADELKAYYTPDPTSGHGPEARRLEALMLLHARFGGMDSVAERCDAAVRKVRGDPALPAAARFAVASFADLNVSPTQNFSSEDVRQARLEQTVRALVEEFPAVLAAGEGMLRLAEESDDARAVRIARDLLKMDVTPEVKNGAQLLLDRQALVGQSLSRLLGPELAATLLPSGGKGRLTLVYAWTRSSDGLFTARQIAGAAPPDAMIIGLNFDSDAAAARTVARDQILPGSQIYSFKGLDPQLTRQLQPSGHDLAFITGRNGVISSVSARIDLSAKILTANK